VITGSGPNAGQIARHAKGFVTVTAGGALDKLFITDPGVGYATVPTVTLGNAGGGTGGSVSQVKIFSTSSGAAFTTVPSDDVRIGRVDAANFTIVAGSGYATTGTAAPATNRLYALYEPAWEYLVQEGMDNFLSIPADNPRGRQLEQQWDHTHALTNCCPRVNGILVAD
jgi:hypothetical protein